MPNNYLRLCDRSIAKPFCVDIIRSDLVVLYRIISFLATDTRTYHSHNRDFYLRLVVIRTHIYLRLVVIRTHI